MSNKTSTFFYKSKPLFGFDIGHASIKIVQLDRSGKNIELAGYGTAYFDPRSLKDGEVVNFDSIVKATNNLIRDSLVGSVSTRRIAASLPVLHSFSKIINLPLMNEKDAFEAVKLEAEQYIPVPINDLYLDYQMVEKTADSQDFLVAAAPKKVIDSYMKLFDTLGLDAVSIEPSILSVTRTVQHAEDSGSPTLVIDCGSINTDLIIYNKETVRVTGTIKFGGETFTRSISEKLGISAKEATHMKSVYGIDPGKEQAVIIGAIAKDLHFFVAEIKKVIRYFEERDKTQNVKVQQIILLGGGANLPGLSTYLTSELRIATRLASVWKNIKMKNIQKPSYLDNSMYATAAGLALIDPAEVVK